METLIKGSLKINCNWSHSVDIQKRNSFFRGKLIPCWMFCWKHGIYFYLSHGETARLNHVPSLWQRDWQFRERFYGFSPLTKHGVFESDRGAFVQASLRNILSCFTALSEVKSYSLRNARCSERFSIQSQHDFVKMESTIKKKNKNKKDVTSNDHP